MLCPVGEVFLELLKAGFHQYSENMVLLSLSQVAHACTVAMECVHHRWTGSWCPPFSELWKLGLCLRPKWHKISYQFLFPCRCSKQRFNSELMLTVQAFPPIQVAKSISKILYFFNYDGVHTPLHHGGSRLNIIYVCHMHAYMISYCGVCKDAFKYEGLS